MLDSGRSPYTGPPQATSADTSTNRVNQTTSFIDMPSGLYDTVDTRYVVSPNFPEPTTPTVTSANHPTPALPKPVRFMLQWNVNSFFGRLAELEMLCHDDPPWVVALQEVNKATAEQMDRSLGKSYKWTVKSGNNFRHSVAIGVRREIPFRIIQLDTDLPIVAVTLEGHCKITVACVYLPCGRLDNLYDRLDSAISKLPEPRVVGGDFNGHHPSWGCPRTDQRGTIIAETAERRDLVILNDGAPTFLRGRHTTAIDITVASRSIAGRLQWHVSPDLHGSDHYPVQVQLHAASVPPTTQRPRWVYQKADWRSYDGIFRSLLEQRNPSNIEDFAQTVYDAASEAVPRTSSKPGRKALRWWNDEVKAVIKARRKALRRLKRLPINHPDREGALTNYRERNNECRQAVRDAKRTSWASFLDSINSSQSSADIWNRVNALSGRRDTGPLHVQVNGTMVAEPSAVADELGRYFASLSAIDEYDCTFRQRVKPQVSSIASFLVPTDTSELRINQPFSWEELQFALGRSSGNSAGPDEIGYPMIKNLPMLGKTRLLELYNQMWTSDTFPSSWRESLVVPIPKGGEPSKDVTKFRPIALTCCLGKVLERMVNRRIKDFLETEGLLDYRQHAFRQGFGTGTYFTALGDILNDAKDKGHHAEVISLDIAKAFNRTWTPLVLKQLLDWGLSGHVIHFVKNFLTGRTFRVIIGDTRSNAFDEETGVPQGSVIAVTLFLVAMNGVFRELPGGVYILVYADDVLLVVVGKTVPRTRIKAQAAVSAVVRWADSVGFQLSARKCVRCHICPSGHRVSGPPIRVHDQPIPLKKTVRVLGVTIDRGLSFEKHLQEVRGAIKTRINLVQTISRPHRTNNRDIRFRVAEAIVDSRLLYGIELTSLAIDNVVRRLEPVYNRCVRIISGLLPSTPAASACVEAGVLPFRLRAYSAIITKAASYASKTIGNDRIFLLDEGDRLLRIIANQALPPVARIHWHGDRGWYRKGMNIDSRIGDRFRAGDNNFALRRSVAELLNSGYPGYAHRFSDGSLSANGVGVGVAGDTPIVSRSLDPKCSVFSAELAGILLAATTPADKPILILTDSKSAISTLAAEAPKHPWAQAIINSAPSSTVLAWIPGHCGVPGNVEADTLAGAGPAGPRITKEVPLQDIRRWIKRVVREAWEVEWNGNRNLFLHKVKGSTDRWVDLPGLRDQRVLSRLRTGHSGLSHCFDGGEFRRTCEVCQLTNTTEHILINCPQFENLREVHGLPHGIRNALGNDASTTTAVIHFLKDAGLYHRV